VGIETALLVGGLAAGAAQQQDTARKTRNAASDARREADIRAKEEKAAGEAAALKTEADAAAASNTRARFMRQTMRANSLLTGGGESPAPTRSTLGV